MPILIDNSHPKPSQVMELAINYAALIRALYSHPKYVFEGEPPVTDATKIDREQTPSALLVATEFAENTYSNFINPFLPHEATEKCKLLSDPWAYAHRGEGEWHWSWDAENKTLKDETGHEVDFPHLDLSRAQELSGDIVMRAFMMRKVVLENGSDAQPTAWLGGHTFDFGDKVKDSVNTLD